MSHQRRAKVSPELARQLDEADSLVGAALTLRSPEPHATVPAEAVEDLAREVLDRVHEQTGLAPDDVNVLKNLGMFSVWASAPFVKALLAQPEIAEAMPTWTAKSPMIRPVKTRPAH
jgi:hypothetical protein